MITIEVARPYSFAASVCDHGWPRLAPFQWIEETTTLQRVEQLVCGQVVVLQIHAEDCDEYVRVHVDIQTEHILSAQMLAEIEQKVRWMLKLEEDLSTFYQHVAQHERVGPKVRTGRGRLLRSPTLFEDVVKTICTTNIDWRQTVSMCQRLVDCLGTPLPIDPTLRAFPTPEQVANAGATLFENEIRLGYRNEYVRRLASEIVKGRRDLESLKESGLSAVELKKELKSIKGVGEYAAGTLLTLLGHYDSLAIDSLMRASVSQQYFGGERVFG